MTSSTRVLQPNERISEILFGLIMVLTFTGSLSVAAAGREEVRTMLIAALGCNIAWGVIDAVLYLMGRLAEKGNDLALLKAVRCESIPDKAQQLIADAVPPAFAGALDSADLEKLRQRLMQMPEPPAYASMSWTDWKGAFGIFLLVFLSTFPVTVPFIFLSNAMLALRISNGIAVVMLFLAGSAYARCVGRPPWLVGLSMVLLGMVLVALTMALGG
jgi:VIT1/CCC1 family predicted Fe2+/Mn2+ transporter